LQTKLIYKKVSPRWLVWGEKGCQERVERWRCRIQILRWNDERWWWFCHHSSLQQTLSLPCGYDSCLGGGGSAIILLFNGRRSFSSGGL